MLLEQNLMPSTSMSIPIESGVDIRQVVTTGTTMQIHHEDEDLSVETSPPNIEHTTIEDTLGYYVGKTFQEFALELTPVDERGFVKKKIIEEGGGEVINENCLVGIAFSGYLEGSKSPFDLRPPVKPLEVNMMENSMLIGLQNAVLTMRVGELSVFFLSYKVMYGEMGNPPKIPQKADCVFYIKIIRCNWSPTVIDENDKYTIFYRTLKDAKMLYKNGYDFHKNGNTQMAVRCFNRAVNLMHNCRLADENEEKQQEEFLLKIYLNLAICYNISKNPKRACSMCNEINRLESIWKNGKALLQNGKALRMLGDFQGAKKRLIRAKQLCPTLSDEIQAEINALNAQFKSYKNSELIATKIIQARNTEQITESFKDEVTKLVTQFVQDPDIRKLSLRPNLNQAEHDFVEEVAKRFKLSFETVKNVASIDKSTSTDNVERPFD